MVLLWIEHCHLCMEVYCAYSPFNKIPRRQKNVGNCLIPWFKSFELCLWKCFWKFIYLIVSWEANSPRGIKMFPTLTLETIFLQELTVRSKQLKPMVPKWVYTLKSKYLKMFAAGVFKFKNSTNQMNSGKSDKLKIKRQFFHPF